jgi:glyoxylase-like metal-dependent hydrolase (beta-lactamase superfamily II)
MIDRRSFLALPALLSLAAAPIGKAFAAPAASASPGIALFMIGDIRVTALASGYIDIGLDLFPRTPRAEGEAALAESPQQRPLRGHVNAFLVESAGRTILVDAGASATVFPTAGRFPGSLQAVGVAAADVDLVVSTHLHVDHIGGLTDANGRAVFDRAALVIAEAERQHWLAAETLDRTRTEARPFVHAARNALAAYAERLVAVSGDREIAPGVRIVPTYGHTPGHSALHLSSGDRQALIWGDIIHAPALQFARPDWTIAFDADQDAAVATRARMLDRSASDRLLVFGAHLPFPGAGYVVRRGQAYRFEAAHHEFGN